MMGFPQSYAGAASEINVGQHVQPVLPEPMPLGIDVPCRRVLLLAGVQDTVYLITQREAGATAVACAAVGFPIPVVGNAPLELWINAITLAWVCGVLGSETVYWYVEER